MDVGAENDISTQYASTDRGWTVLLSFPTLTFTIPISPLLSTLPFRLPFISSKWGYSSSSQGHILHVFVIRRSLFVVFFCPSR